MAGRHIVGRLRLRVALLLCEHRAFLETSLLPHGDLLPNGSAQPGLPLRLFRARIDIKSRLLEHRPACRTRGVFDWRRDRLSRSLRHNILGDNDLLGAQRRAEEVNKEHIG